MQIENFAFVLVYDINLISLENLDDLLECLPFYSLALLLINVLGSKIAFNKFQCCSTIFFCYSTANQMTMKFQKVALGWCTIDNVIISINCFIDKLSIFI